jgi:tRNA threonylcarbamoyladenosine biosynthesis protein TsaE
MTRSSSSRRSAPGKSTARRGSPRRRNRVSFETRSPEETRAKGRALGRLLRAGDTLLLSANLGGGKTTFVQGVASGLGVRSDVMSPTFVLAQSLPGKTFLHHLDFYRLEKNEIFDMGIHDYVNASGAIAPGVVVIEWPERCPEMWPEERIEIQIKAGRDPLRRRFTARARGERPAAVLERWA